jgi:TPR repeat protein
MYRNGLGIRQDSVQAAVWFRKAAEQGDESAQVDLGLLYTDGYGVPRNYAEAMKWTLMAAKQGDSFAQHLMASFYEDGLGMPQNYILAYMWYSVSAHNPEQEPIARKYQKNSRRIWLHRRLPRRKAWRSGA